MANSAAAAATAVAVAVAASSNNQPEPEKQAADDRYDHLRQVALGILAAGGSRLTEEEAEKEEAGHRIPVGMVVTNLTAAFEENGDDDDYDDDYDNQTFATGDQTFATGDCLSQSQLGCQMQPGNVPNLDERQRSINFSNLVKNGRIYKGTMTESVAGGSYMNESQKAAVARDFRSRYTPANTSPMAAMDTDGRPTVTATNKLSPAQQRDKQWADNFVDLYEYADKNSRKNGRSQEDDDDNCGYVNADGDYVYADDVYAEDIFEPLSSVRGNRRLVKWLRCQRALYRRNVNGEKTSLNEERVYLLGCLNIDWHYSPPTRLQGLQELQEFKWKHRLQELREFKWKHGHCNVPVDSGPLGSWVGKSRARYRGVPSLRGNPLKPDQIDQLNLLGLQWNGTGRANEGKSRSSGGTKIKSWDEFDAAAPTTATRCWCGVCAGRKPHHQATKIIHLAG